MLIIEGTDIVGKTTLCNTLIKKLWELNFPIIYQHFGRLPNSWDYFDDYLACMNRKICMDRFIMSEVAYGQMLRTPEGSKISPEMYYELDGWLRINGSVTVVITADREWLRKQLEIKYEQRVEEFEPNEILDVNDYFKKLVEYKTDWTPDFDFCYEVNDRTGFPSSNKQLVSDIVLKVIERYNSGPLRNENKDIVRDG